MSPSVNENSLASRLAIIALYLAIAGCGGDSASSSAPSNTSNNDVPAVQVVSEPAEQPQLETPQPSTPEESQVVESQVVGDDHHDISQGVRFTDSNLDIWPPQPVDIKQVTSLTDLQRETGDERVRRISSFQSKSLPGIDNAISNLIGARHEVLTQHYLRDKSGKASRVDVEIFNYDTNQVITVELDAQSNKIISQRSDDAHQYQPPESQAEVARAIKLAAADLTRQGFTEHTRLQGTGLLAFPTSVETAASGTNFFSERKIYITFGTGNGVLPHYRALVNLSTNTVESSGSIQ